MKKNDARKFTPEIQEHVRCQAIRLRESGMKYREIAEILGVHYTTICTWFKKYEREGAESIRSKKRGRPLGSCRTLSPDQELEIRDTIREKYPDELGLPFALWDRKAVRELIRKLYSIEMPIRTVGEYLKRWDFTPQKPLKRAYKQNPRDVKKWLEEDYPQIQRRAKDENAEIHWGDETGLCNDAYCGRGYAPRGETPVIRVHSRCQRINLVSTITNQGKVRFKLYEEKMNARTFIEFLERLIRDTVLKVFLIVDNLKVHHSIIVEEWVSKHKDQIEIFFLPSYSPELNPNEYLNCDFKNGVHSSIPAKTKEELKKKALSHLRKLQKLPKRVAKYFEHPKIAYAK